LPDRRQAGHTARPGSAVEVFSTIIARYDLGLARPDGPGGTVFVPPGRAAV
jgi:hypothetical protein